MASPQRKRKPGCPCPCGGGVNPCNTATWPTPLYLTVSGVTVTLNFGAFGAFGTGWFGTGNFPIAGVISAVGVGPCLTFTDCGTPKGNIDITFSVGCNAITHLPSVTVYWSTCGSNACNCTNYDSYTDTNVSTGTGNTNTAAFTSFINSPVSGSGTMPTATSPVTCGILSGTVNFPLNGQGFVLTQ